MKSNIFFAAFIFFFGFLFVLQCGKPIGTGAKKSVYDFVLNSINGGEISLKEYKGKVLLIVNVASKCGYTPQYENLVSVYNRFKDRDFLVLGFPANNFGQQEPGTNAEIKEFCTLNYDVTFPMFSKISVKGDDQDPIFAHLTSAENQDFTGEIKWNFEKFLISRDGKLLRRFRSKVSPDSDEITSAILSAL